MIYFDNAASTQTLESAAEVLHRMLVTEYVNPASMSKLGVLASQSLRQSAQILARGIHARPEEIYFTSGGTEGNNWLIFGTAKGYHRRGKHIITTQTEHPSVKQPMLALEREGFEVTWLPVDEKGYLSLDVLADAIRPDTILVSLLFVNNETGTIQDLEALGNLIKTKNPSTLFHTDAVQGFGKHPLDVLRMKIDLLTMSAHKLHGPKGAGLCYIRDGLLVRPLILGGGQQQGQRSGTENAPIAASMAQVAEESFSHMAKNHAKALAVKTALWESIDANIPNIRQNGDGLEAASPYVLNVSFLGVRAEVLLHALENEGIYVSAGSACDSKKKTGSAVLGAMGLSDAEIQGAIRFSFCRFNTVVEAEECAAALQKIVPMLRKYQR